MQSQWLKSIQRASKSHNIRDFYQFKECVHEHFSQIKHESQNTSTNSQHEKEGEHGQDHKVLNPSMVASTAITTTGDVKFGGLFSVVKKSVILSDISSKAAREKA